MRRTTEITHVGTICFANMHAGYLEMMRGDPIQTDPFANALARLARDHDLKMWTAFGVFLEGWTAWQAGARDAGLAGMRDGVSQLAEQGVVVFDGLIKTKLAQAEADDGAIVAALTIIDQAIAVSERTGHRWYDAEIRRTRGEILFKQNSENPAPAEDAFLAAIAIAQAAEGPQLRTARRAFARQALSRIRPRRRRPRRARPGARRFLADAGVSGDRGGEGAARRAGGDRRGESRRRAPRATAEIADQLRPGCHVVQGLRRRGNERRLRARRRARDRDWQCGDAWSKPIMLGSAAVCFAASSGRPGRRPKASFAKRNARRGRRRWLPRIAFWDWFSSSKAISCRLGRIANRR